MSRIPLLPRWVLGSTLPSAYDSESATVQEMVSKVQGAMNALITDYNAFVDQINGEISSYSASSAEEIENIRKSVEERLRCKFNDIDARLGEIKSDLLQYTQKYLQENIQGALPIISAADEGKLLQVIGGSWQAAVPTFSYDPETEALSLTIVGGE